MNKELETFVRCLSRNPEDRLIQDLTCVKSFLKTIDDLKSFKDATISEYARIARYEVHESNYVLFKKGDVCKSWYIVLSGSVLVGCQKMFLPRSSFGRRSQGNLYRTEECTVLDDTELIVFDYSVDRDSFTISKKPKYKSPIYPKDLQVPNTDSSISMTLTPSANSPIFFQSSLNGPNGQNMTPSANKRESHASDTSSAYSGSDAAFTGSETGRPTPAATSTSSYASDNEDNDDDDDDDDEDDVSSQDISMSDVFLEVLTKDVEARTSQDIEIIVSNIQNLVAFSQFTEHTRYELCRVMRVAIVNSENGEPSLLMESGEVMETWNVVLEGAVEIRDSSTGAVREFARGDCFGVRPTMDEQCQQGDLWTVAPYCIFWCATQKDFTEIVTRDNDTIVPETTENGHTVLIYEQRGDNNTKTRNVIVKGTKEKLLNCLLFDRYKSDMSYMEHFLLTYRVFINSPRVLANKLCQWYNGADIKTKEMIMKCLVMWANNHFADFDDPNCNMTDYLEKFDEILSKNESSNDKILFNLACRNNSKPRLISVRCDKCFLKNNPIQLVGFKNGYGLFVKEINRAACKDAWNLRKGDQIMSIASKPWEFFENLEKASAFLYQNLANSVELLVKFNPSDLQSFLNSCLEPEACVNQNETFDSSNSEQFAMMFKHLRGNRTCSIIENRTISRIRSGSVTLQGISDHMRVGISAMVTPMNIPKPEDFEANKSANHNKPTATTIGSPPLKHRSYSISNNNGPCNKALLRTGTQNVIDNSDSRSAHTSPTRPICSKSKQAILEKQKKQQPIKDKKLNSRSSSNPNLKDAIDAQNNSSAHNSNTSSNSSGGSSTTTKRSTSVSNNRNNNYMNNTLTQGELFNQQQENQIIKVFRPNSVSDWKLISINNTSTVQEVLPNILKEFSIDKSEIPNYALYMVTVEPGTGPIPLIKTSMTAHFIRDLADRLSLNQRYYLKNRATDSQLITDDQAKQFLKESTVTIHDLRDNASLATRLTQMDYALFRDIQPAEYINFIFKLPALNGEEYPDQVETDEESGEIKGFSTGCSNYERFEQTINRQSFWPTTEICREQNLQTRVALLKRFIKIAQMCRDLKNFNSMLCIVTGISLSPVNRLKATWEKLSTKYRKIFDELCALTEFSFNFRCLRQLELPDVTEPPLIPCMAIHSKDLSVIHMNYKTVSQDLINFEKMRMMSNEIRKLCQMCSSEYNLTSIIQNLQNPRANPPLSSNNSSTLLSNQHHQSLDESDATSGISGCSGNTSDNHSSSGGITLMPSAAANIVQKMRSNSVDHSGGLNDTLKKRNAKRKSLNMAEPLAKKPQKIYDEWLMTLKVKTYWSNVYVEMDIKKLQEMSDAAEPSQLSNSLNSSTNLSNTSESGPTKKLSTSSLTSSTQPSPSASSKTSSKSTKVINLSSPNKSPSSETVTTKSNIQQPSKQQQQQPIKAPQQDSTNQNNPPIVLRNPITNQNQSAHKPTNKNRPQSIFTSQTSEDNDKLKEMVYYSRKKPSQRQYYYQQQQQQQYQQQQQIQYSSQNLQPVQGPNVTRIRNPNFVPDNVMLQNCIPMYEYSRQTPAVYSRENIPPQPPVRYTNISSNTQQLPGPHFKHQTNNINQQYMQNYHYPTAGSSNNSNSFTNPQQLSYHNNNNNNGRINYVSHLSQQNYFNYNSNSGPGSTCSSGSNNTNLSNSSSNLSNSTRRNMVANTNINNNNRPEPPAYDMVLLQRLQNNSFEPNVTNTPVTGRPPMSPPSYTECMNRSLHNRPSQSRGVAQSNMTRSNNPPPPPPPRQDNHTDYRHSQH